MLTIEIEVAPLVIKASKQSIKNKVIDVVSSAC